MKKLNQSGMSAILFAMVFVVILSLLAVAFATLVRNDQRQVLDKTISFQAQYAAETAINRKAAELQANPSATSQATCVAFDLSDPGFNASAKVTCLTWLNEVDSIEKQSLGTEPFITQLEPTPAASFSSVTIKWKATNSITNTYPSLISNLPAIASANIPILRLTIADIGNINAAKTAYFVPSNSQNNLAVWSDGDIGTAQCTVAGDCSITVGFSSSRAYVSLAAYGNKADITSITVSGNPKLKGAQAVIDANARVQEITKRVVARVSLLPQTWNPGFAVSANKICKDYRVDGTQNKPASETTAPVCPSEP